MPTADEFRTELRAQLHQAQQEGFSRVEINAGDLHRKVGGYPGPKPRLPCCCSVMRQEQRQGDLVVSERHSDGVSLTIRYLLPRERT